jgi:hypothetical protein
MTAVYLARTSEGTRNNFQATVAAIGETIYTTFPRGTSCEEIRRIGALGVPGTTRGQQQGLLVVVTSLAVVTVVMAVRAYQFMQISQIRIT